jgi:TusA-related sulfurtransferase
LRAIDSHFAATTVTRTVTVANAAPQASFTWTQTANDYTLDATATDAEHDPLSYRWDLDGDGTFETAGARVTKHLVHGERPVAVKVTDAPGASVTVSRTLSVKDAPPAGDFSFTDQPLSGETVHFATTGATDPDGDAVTASWDLDDDGTFETAGDAADASFRSPGPHTVALRLADPSGESVVVRHTVAVGNRAPVAAFDASAGPDVTLTSRSSDPDGGTMQLREEWDLDGDGEFDDATGPVAHRTYSPGQIVVRLRVTDGDGASTVAEHALGFTDPIRVATPSELGPRAMSPFPVVRMRGRLTRHGAFVQFLGVSSMPANAHVAITCRGKSCPQTARPLSLRSVTRELRAGTILEVRITAPGTIGKLVRFTIRRGKPWLRVDGCLTAAGAATRCA